jgi:HD-GYP domain-containing protein (c-di-GMP phosphodiesterase class II)
MLCSIVLILLIFLTSTVDFSTLLLGDNSRYTLKDWNYLLSQTKPKVTQKVANWEFSNRQEDISKPSNTKYIHLQTILPEIKNPSVLKIITLSNPILIIINGKTLLDNGYSSNEIWTGNKENEIQIGKSYSTETIDIYMRTAIGFGFISTLKPLAAINKLELFYYQIQVMSGYVFIIIGLLAIFLTILFSIKHKKIGGLAVCGALLILVGLLYILPNLSFFLINSTDPIFFKLQLVSLMFIFAFFIVLTLNVTQKNSRFSRLFISILFVYPLIFAFIQYQTILYYMLIAYPALVLFSLIIYIVPITRSIGEDDIGGSFIYAGYFLFGITFLADFASYVYGLSKNFHNYRFFGIYFYLIILIAIIIRKFIFLNIRLDERDNQIRRDSMWTERIIRACAEIFVQKDIESFCIQTAKSIKSLILSDIADQYHKTIIELLQEGNITVNVGLKSDAVYTEIYSEGENSFCNFMLVEEKHINKKEEQVYFGSSYIDILLFEKGTLICIIHFEGIHQGLSKNLKNIIMFAYTNISVALDNLSLQFEMTKTQETIFFNLADISEAKSEETGSHPKRVAEYVKVMCEEMLMDPKQTKIVSRASMMHDIGKLAIPEEIITKKGILTTQEYEIVKQHVLFGYHIMSKSSGEFMKAAAIIAQQHHERWNGQGYLGLKGEEIHIYARIVALVDVFDALLTERSYKAAWSFEQTCNYINEKSGSQFDPAVVDVFNRVFYRLNKIRGRYPD